MLVGNKTDLADKRAVSTADGEARARELKTLFIETSAKVAHNVKSLFRRVAQALPTAAEPEPADEADVLTIVPLSAPAVASQESGCAC